jgi:peptidoglycan/LPS O-acetylase OafA/YrhL
MPQLDSLRTMAVFAVLVSHYKSQWMQWFHWGWAGVQLFFVLSGFLITGILLGARGPGPGAPADPRHSLKAFYLRRFLRIFPLYYAVILVMIVIYPEERALAGWHLLYASNIWMAIHGKFVFHTLHFWSLCVEEQFYLVWPLVVLFVPRRRLLPVLLAAIASASLYRTAALALGWTGAAVGYLPISNLDALGLGALLALLSAEDWGRRIRERCLKGALAAGLPLFAILLAIRHGEGIGHVLLVILSPLALALIFFWLVGRASTGFSGPLKAVLEWGPFVYLGKISYGLYVYHAAILESLHWTFAHAGIPLFLKPLAYLGATVAVAALSWHFFERPINNLRMRIGYRSPAPAVSGASPANAEATR